MVKLLLSKTMLLLCALVAGSGSVWADGTLISDLSDITEETYYIAALNSSKYYTVPNTTISGQTFTCTEATYENNVLTPPTGAGEFVFTPVSGVDNAFYIYNTNLNKYLVATGSKTFGYVDNKSSDYGYWTFSTVSSGGFSGVFSVQHSSKTHYMRAFSSSVRCYDGASNSGVYLFKKTAPDTRTATSLTIDDTGITNTNVYTSTAAGSLSATVMAGESAVEGATVTWSSGTTSVATIASDGTVTLVGAGTTTITASFAGDASYKPSTNTYTLTVINENPNQPGTSTTPYTVAQAIDAIDNNGNKTDVYVQGIISRVVSYTSTYPSLSYTISTDGTTTSQQFYIYSGKGLNGANFSGLSDLTVGDRVVVKGTIKSYTSDYSNYEMDYNNELYSHITKLPNTITVTGGTEFTINRENNEEDLTLTATATSGATVTFTVDTDNTTVDANDYDFDNGYLLVSGTTSGVIIIKANAAGDDDYKAADEVTITVNVQGIRANATILVEDAEVAYGSTYTVDESLITGGPITVTSGNENIATVSGLVITPKAVGTVEITVSTAATGEYKAGSETFNLTVKAPEAQTTAPTASEPVTLDFTSNTSWKFPTSSGTTAENTYSNGTYSVKLTGTTAYYYFETNHCLLIGKKDATIELPAFNNAVTQIDITCPSGGSGKTTMNIYVGDKAVSTSVTGSDSDHSFVIDENYRAKGTVYKLKVTNGNNAQIKTMTINFAEETITAKLNASGFATFCSEYPLDFSGATDYSAWQITNIDTDNKITFEQITGSVKGGTGIFLKGTAGETITLTSANSSTVLGSNKLEGTLAPKYVATGEYYGLSGNNFVKISAGNVPEGKAILPAGLINESAGARFTFVFSEESGISATLNKNEATNNVVFDLQGRRVNKPVKGLYIMDGKKVMVK